MEEVTQEMIQEVIEEMANLFYLSAFPKTLGALDMNRVGCTGICVPLELIRKTPEAWFRGSPVDARDRALINAEPVLFVAYTSGSFLRKISEWRVETEEACQKMVAEAGGRLIGFDPDLSNPTRWSSMAVHVNITGRPFAGLDWGYLTAKPANIRIFRCPPEKVEPCEKHGEHGWDAMTLRDCYTTTDGIRDIDSIASRFWDILLIKMWEDFDHPWLVAAVKDAGPFTEEDCRACSCLHHDE
ncbi:hypothetical protein SLS62_002455 [Diatrype stigma]|uniref:Uncharacterized protein n=1 Tax=Diatrype stigma TaxID=117547 RepID=A0AAN9YQT9_9PEZI